MTTTIQCGTISDFIVARCHDSLKTNKEQLEAFLSELFQLHVQVVQECDNGFSLEAQSSFPTVPEHSLEDLTQWSVELLIWIAELSPLDCEILKQAEVVWE